MHHTHQPMPLDRMFKEAWQLVRGSKFTYFVTYVVFIITNVIIYLIATSLTKASGHIWLGNVLDFLLAALFLAPLFTGLSMIGVQRARGLPICWRSGLNYYHMIPRLFLAFAVSVVILWVMLMVFNFLGILLLFMLHFAFKLQLNLTVTFITSFIFSFIVFAIYESFTLFNFILVVDKKVNPLLAWWYSCKMTAPHYGKIFLAFIYLSLFNILGFCLLGIGLLWTLPWSYLVFAKMYVFCEHDREHPDLIEE